MLRFIVGSYASQGTSGIFEMECVNGRFTITGRNSDAENPSYLFLHPNGQVLYAAEECVPNGRVAVFQKKNHQWVLTERIDAGSSPCHLEMDETYRYLFASNYMDGSISVYTVSGNGFQVTPLCCIRHSGHGINPQRQKSPHMHSCLCKDGLCYAADLGLDSVFVYSISDLVKAEPVKIIRFPAGCGVRHMAFHPKHADKLYVNAEMSGEVFVTDRNSGRILQSLSVVSNPKGNYATSAIKIAGDLLCVATRGENRVAFFRIKNSGLLETMSIHPLRDNYPRDLFFDGQHLLLANQGDMSLGYYTVNETCDLTHVCEISMAPAHPSCIICTENNNA